MNTSYHDHQLSKVHNDAPSLSTLSQPAHAHNWQQGWPRARAGVRRGRMGCRCQCPESLLPTVNVLGIVPSFPPISRTTADPLLLCCCCSSSSSSSQSSSSLQVHTSACTQLLNTHPPISASKPVLCCDTKLRFTIGTSSRRCPLRHSLPTNPHATHKSEKRGTVPKSSLPCFSPGAPLSFFALLCLVKTPSITIKQSIK